MGGAGEEEEERRAAREALEERFATGESGAAEAAMFGVTRPCGAPPWPAMPAPAGLDP